MLLNRVVDVKACVEGLAMASVLHAGFQRSRRGDIWCGQSRHSADSDWLARSQKTEGRRGGASL